MRYTIDDRRLPTFDPKPGDLAECQVTLSRKYEFTVVAVSDKNTGGGCIGCLGDLKFNEVDGDSDDLCQCLPSKCGMNSLIWQPACDESMRMLAMIKLEGEL